MSRISESDDFPSAWAKVLEVVKEKDSIAALSRDLGVARSSIYAGSKASTVRNMGYGITMAICERAGLSAKEQALMKQLWIVSRFHPSKAVGAAAIELARGLSKLSTNDQAAIFGRAADAYEAHNTQSRRV